MIVERPGRDEPLLFSAYLVKRFLQVPVESNDMVKEETCKFLGSEENS
jgi:hypothetical protein